MPILSAAVDAETATLLRARAASRKQTTHRYLVETLQALARMPADTTPLPATAINDISSPIALDVSIDLATRLQTCSRLIGMPATSIARAMLSHHCFEANDIMERLAKVDTAYQDSIGFIGKREYRAGRTWYRLAFKMHTPAWGAVGIKATQAKTTRTKLARAILHRYLPQFPFSDEYLRETYGDPVQYI